MATLDRFRRHVLTPRQQASLAWLAQQDSSAAEQEHLAAYAEAERRLEGARASASVLVAKQRANLSKNRYSNVLPFDWNRVVLGPASAAPAGSSPLSSPQPTVGLFYGEGLLGGDGKRSSVGALGDYINASWIQPQHGSHRYIATQGPLPNTVGDFWRMCLHTRAETVVMLTRVREKQHSKCHQYYPESPGESLELGEEGLTVTCDAAHDLAPDVALRRLVIKCTRKQGAPAAEQLFTVSHLLYSGWPDHGIPETTESILNLRELALSLSSPESPIVAHCSAGIGRTGTFIGLDMALHKVFDGSGILDEGDGIQQIVTQLRQQRQGMVQTSEQYAFICRAVRHALRVAGSA
mmetsp:Transcript_10209/g.37547  ORF Transcript_10209/g.37547 Transcript_10209/m.37547 type:complete len:351 (-) Transcript_10209:1036-2088(-)